MNVFACSDGTVIEAADDDEFVAMFEAHLRFAHPEMAGRLSRQDILARAADSRPAREEKT